MDISNVTAEPVLNFLKWMLTSDVSFKIWGSLAIGVGELTLIRWTRKLLRS